MDREVDINIRYQTPGYCSHLRSGRCARRARSPRMCRNNRNYVHLCPGDRCEDVIHTSRILDPAAAVTWHER